MVYLVPVRCSSFRCHIELSRVQEEVTRSFPGSSFDSDYYYFLCGERLVFPPQVHLDLNIRSQLDNIWASVVDDVKGDGYGDDPPLYSCCHGFVTSGWPLELFIVLSYRSTLFFFPLRGEPCFRRMPGPSSCLMRTLEQETYCHFIVCTFLIGWSGSSVVQLYSFTSATCQHALVSFVIPFITGSSWTGAQKPGT